MKRFLLLMPLLLALALVSAACGGADQETGVLEGHVTIGPLTPVVQEGVPEPTVAPDVYAARQVVVYAADGRRELARVQIDSHGDYRVALPVGSYLVDVNHVSIGGGIGLPQQVEIVEGETIRLDIEIDTGIR